MAKKYVITDSGRQILTFATEMKTLTGKEEPDREEPDREGRT